VPLSGKPLEVSRSHCAIKTNNRGRCRVKYFSEFCKRRFWRHYRWPSGSVSRLLRFGPTYL